ncbi:MAG: hypothetical protein J5644_02920 [Bacteroidales bacterium]|nr:hypothetical protein [Bacteroidales bacterium]
MKKIILFFALLLTMFVSSAQKTWFVGGTAGFGYTDNFTFSLEPQFGYEFTDKWAIGTGLGLALSSSEGYTVVLGVTEPFVRFCAWHNDRIFIDLKATAGIGFDDELELCQIGIRPSLRFRINDHWDIAADLGLFGAQYTYSNGWTPAIGISATSVGLWFNYRF